MKFLIRFSSLLFLFLFLCGCGTIPIIPVTVPNTNSGNETAHTTSRVIISKLEHSIEMQRNNSPNNKQVYTYTHSPEITSLLIAGEITTNNKGVIEFSLHDIVRSYNKSISNGGGFSSEGLFGSRQVLYFFVENPPIITCTAKSNEPILVTIENRQEKHPKFYNGSKTYTPYNPLVKIYSWDINGRPKGNEVINFMLKAEYAVDLIIN